MGGSCRAAIRCAGQYCSLHKKLQNWAGTATRPGPAIRLLGQFDYGRVVHWKADSPKRILRGASASDLFLREKSPMLADIRRFFDEQRGPPPKWPEHLPAISPITGEDLQAESERHWRLAMRYLDEIEAVVIRLYEDGAHDPSCYRCAR
jgi:hypothetical protein